MKNNYLGVFLVALTITTISCTYTDSNQQKEETTEQNNRVEDYFLPEAPNNKVDYSVPNSSMTKSRYYIKKDSIYLVKDSSFVQGEASNIEIKTIQLINNEAHVIQSTLGYGVGYPKATKYNPPLIILKVPSKGEILNWTTTDQMNGTIDYMASWEEVTYENKKTSVIKVQKSFESTSIKEVDYYAKGIGLLKTVVQTSNSGMEKLKLEGISHVSGLE